MLTFRKTVGECRRTFTNDTSKNLKKKFHLLNYTPAAFQYRDLLSVS